MKNRSLFSIIFCFVLLGCFYFPVRADGIVVPELPPAILCDPQPCPGDIYPRPMSQLSIRYHHVTVTIEDQLAVTHVDQVFYNPNNWPVEGTYIFPLPVEATVSDFRLWIDNEAVQGKVLDAEEARRTYEEIVSSLRDPALLEYIGRGALQASIFPIPPEGERRIELEYSQVLKSENGLVKYSYPLNTEKFSQQALESVRVSVSVVSSQPIRAAYSPSHKVALERDGDQKLSVSYEASDITPDKDFVLYFSLGETEAFHLFTYRDPSGEEEQDGFFLMLLAPSPEEETATVAKDILLVLDRSGSMDGVKLSQAKEALRYILGHLNDEDRFYLLTFNSGMRAYAPGLRSSAEGEEAIAWAEDLNAEGSTDINRALLEVAAVADDERPTYLIFLTDGLPTEGETDSEKIFENFSEVGRDNLRLFPFGVGYDVDTYLLDSLSNANHGLSTYVKPGESLDEALSGFYSRISTPVLTDLALDFGALDVSDIYPNPLPDLFADNQVVVVGRYRKGGSFDVSLSGESNGKVQEFTYPDQFFERDSFEKSDLLTEIPRLWATRKIGYLLNKVRLDGGDQETIEQIVKLSVRYGIVTPYTSYLVSEPMSLGAENMQRMAEDTFQDMQSQPAAPASGQAAVEKAAGQGALSQADVASEMSGMDARLVRTIGAKTFVNQMGKWVDTGFDPHTMTPLRISFLSADYFALAQSRLDAAAALALGERVIVILGGQVYEIVGEAEQADPVILPATPAEPGNKNDQPASPVSEDQQDDPATPVEREKDNSSQILTGSLIVLAFVCGGMMMVWWAVKEYVKR